MVLLRLQQTTLATSLVMPPGHTWRAITNEFILCSIHMNYELPLDPEDAVGTPEWEAEREWRLRTHLEFVESLDTDDLDKAIRFCRKPSHR